MEVEESGPSLCERRRHLGVPVARGGHPFPCVVAVDGEDGRQLRDQRQFVQEVVHGPQWHGEVGEATVLVGHVRREHVGQGGPSLLVGRGARVVLDARGLLDEHLLELRLLREVGRDQQVRARVRVFVELRALELRRHLSEEGGIGHAVGLVGELRRLGAEAERPVGRVRQRHHEPPRLLATREQVVECARLADAELARQQQTALLAERAFLLPLQQLVAHRQPALPHHHRRALQPPCAFLDRVATEASVVEELEGCGAALKLVEATDVVDCVLKRVIARAEDLRGLDSHSARSRAWLPVYLLASKQHVALL